MAVMLAVVPAMQIDLCLISIVRNLGRQSCVSANLVTSGLSGLVTQDGIKVEICIYRLEHEKPWTLEVVNAAGTSVVWDEQFSSDEEAYAEFKRTVADEGMQVFLDQGNVIPFRR